MKIFILAALFILSSGHSIPQIPGDNSHYVEGESRYIWIPDGEGTPILVDLHEPVNVTSPNTRNGANNQYWLFTRQNPTTPQIIVHNDINSLRNSNYLSSRPTKVIVHGWRSSGNSNMNPLITAAFLDVCDCNVIVLDWSRLANGFYNVAVSGVPSVGVYLGNFLVWVYNILGGNWNHLHLVGFSLGAHVVGNAGRTAGGLPGRVTGLDPAGLQWYGNPNALNKNAGSYVECIHTDGGLLGIFDPLCDADFYPNGGKNPQPGCWISTCSHSRAPELFAATVKYNHLVGAECASLRDAERGNCSGERLNMGNAVIGKRGYGLYGLATGGSWFF